MYNTMHTNLSSEDVMRMRIKRRRERQEERKRAILEARASSDDYKTKVPGRQRAMAHTTRSSSPNPSLDSRSPELEALMKDTRTAERSPTPAPTLPSKTDRYSTDSSDSGRSRRQKKSRSSSGRDSEPLLPAIATKNHINNKNNTNSRQHSDGHNHSSRNSSVKGRAGKTRRMSRESGWSRGSTETAESGSPCSDEDEDAREGEDTKFFEMVEEIAMQEKSKWFSILELRRRIRNKRRPPDDGLTLAQRIIRNRRRLLHGSNSASENSTEDIYEDAQEELSADDRKRKQIIDLWYRPDARHDTRNAVEIQQRNTEMLNSRASSKDSMVTCQSHMSSVPTEDSDPDSEDSGPGDSDSDHHVVVAGAASSSLVLAGRHDDLRKSQSATERVLQRDRVPRKAISADVFREADIEEANAAVVIQKQNKKVKDIRKKKDEQTHKITEVSIETESRMTPEQRGDKQTVVVMTTQRQDNDSRHVEKQIVLQAERPASPKVVKVKKVKDKKKVTESGLDVTVNVDNDEKRNTPPPIVPVVVVKTESKKQEKKQKKSKKEALDINVDASTQNSTPAKTDEHTINVDVNQGKSSDNKTVDIDITAKESDQNTSSNIGIGIAATKSTENIKKDNINVKIDAPRSPENTENQSALDINVDVDNNGDADSIRNSESRTSVNVDVSDNQGNQDGGDTSVAVNLDLGDGGSDVTEKQSDAQINVAISSNVAETPPRENKSTEKNVKVKSAEKKTEKKGAVAVAVAAGAVSKASSEKDIQLSADKAKNDNVGNKPPDVDVNVEVNIAGGGSPEKTIEATLPDDVTPTDAPPGGDDSPSPGEINVDVAVGVASAASDNPLPPSEQRDNPDTAPAPAASPANAVRPPSQQNDAAETSEVADDVPKPAKPGYKKDESAKPKDKPAKWPERPKVDGNTEAYIKALEKIVDKNLSALIKGEQPMNKPKKKAGAANPPPPPPPDSMSRESSVVDKILNDEPFTDQDVDEFASSVGDDRKDASDTSDSEPDIDDDTLDQLLNGDFSKELDKFLGI